ncbi:MAG: 50S ribosomal protein L19 [Candidatus Pacebacteria bacterium]|nr:50S ribosomal protein L19 [Candidatus Paceibacterota bacterium]
MTLTLIDFNHTNTRKDLPQIRPGHVVKVHQKITEIKGTGKKQEIKERIQIFEGLVIGVKGGTGLNATITVRKISGGIGVERIFPVNTPTVEKIEIIKITKARRAKLNYMRDRFGKATKPKGELATEKDNEPMTSKGVNKKLEEEMAEEVEAVTEEEKIAAEEIAQEEVVAETEEKEAATEEKKEEVASEEVKAEK